jgi:hypothetical protein
MIHIAKTKKEYSEGLKDPSKNIMYFPNANNMTMKGMKTPIKYYGITDGMITDEGYARPGQKFNVNGISTLEVRMPNLRKMQTSGFFSKKLKYPSEPSADFTSSKTINKDQYKDMIQLAKDIEKEEFKRQDEESDRRALEFENDRKARTNTDPRFVLKGVDADLYSVNPEAIQKEVNFYNPITNRYEKRTDYYEDPQGRRTAEYRQAVLNRLRQSEPSNLSSIPSFKLTTGVPSMSEGLDLDRILSGYGKPSTTNQQLAQDKTTINTEDLPVNDPLADYMRNKSNVMTPGSLSKRANLGIKRDPYLLFGTDLSKVKSGTTQPSYNLTQAEKLIDKNKSLYDNLKDYEDQYERLKNTSNAPAAKIELELVKEYIDDAKTKPDFDKKIDEYYKGVQNKVDQNLKSQGATPYIPPVTDEDIKRITPQPVGRVFNREAFEKNLESGMSQTKPTSLTYDEYIKKNPLKEETPVRGAYTQLLNDVDNKELNEAYTLNDKTRLSNIGKKVMNPDQPLDEQIRLAQEEALKSKGNPNEEKQNLARVAALSAYRDSENQKIEATRNQNNPKTTSTTSSNTTVPKITDADIAKAEKAVNDAKGSFNQRMLKEELEVLKQAKAKQSASPGPLGEEKYKSQEPEILVTDDVITNLQKSIDNETDPVKKAKKESELKTLKDIKSKQPAVTTTSTGTTTTSTGTTTTGNTTGTGGAGSLNTFSSTSPTILTTSSSNFTPGRTLKYTDGQWYMTPSGTQYRTYVTPESQRAFDRAKGLSYTEEPVTKKQQREIDEEESPNRNTKLYRDYYGEPDVRSQSSRRRDKLRDIYDNMDRGVGNFMNRMQMDRSDRAIDRYNNLMDKAEMAKEIGNDRRSGRLTRRANRVLARVPALEIEQNANEKIKDANEKIRDARNEVELSRISLNSARRANRRDELAKRLEQRAEFLQQRAGLLPEILSRRINSNIDEYDERQLRKREADKSIYERELEKLDERIKEKLRNEEAEKLETQRVQKEGKQKVKNMYRDPLLKGKIREKVREKGQFNLQTNNPIRSTKGAFEENRNVGIFDEPWQTPEVKLRDVDFKDWYAKRNPGVAYSGQTYFGGTDPSFTLNYNRILSGKPFDDTEVDDTEIDDTEDIDTKEKSTGTNKDFSGNKYFITKGEATQLAGSLLPGFYNLAQSMRKPHKFKEFQNPNDFQYLSNLASYRMPYDDSKIIAQQNRIMRAAQQNAPNFQVAQAYQTAGMDSMNRQLKDYQMKNYMANQQYAQDYNRAAQDVYGKREAIKADVYAKDRATQAALNQLQHKAVTQLGIGIHDLGKLFVNRENQNVDWSMLGEIYNQYGLAPIEAVANGDATGAQIIQYKGNPEAMQKFLDQLEKEKSENKARRDAQKKEETTTTGTVVTPPSGGAANRKMGGRVFNINAINNINKYR